MVGNTLAARLESHVRMLAESIGERNVYHPDALAEASAYIENVWQEQGYRVTPQSYEVESIPCSNLEVNHAGTKHPEQILLIGAHYDTVSGSPGANDNGSGVAALLEIARLLKGVETDCTVRLVAFVNEESPFFFRAQMGSMVYAREARKRNDDIRLMISLEMLGYYSERPGSQRYLPLFRFFYPDRANFIAFVSNLRSRHMLHRFSAAFRRHSHFPAEHVATFSWIPGVAWSDHLAFWRQGYRAIMVTDTAFFRYPHYHAATDLPDELDYTSLAAVTEGVAHAVTATARDD
ncbi:MAG: M28 family metallopeptidase [Gammaproteobacteria bacterium]|nr:MAG: M28 family metallopeptidase [Gammaproteobacteria bacterium]